MSEDGLNLTQSLADPCVFYRKDQDGKAEGMIVLHVDDCALAVW